VFDLLQPFFLFQPPQFLTRFHAHGFLPLPQVFLGDLPFLVSFSGFFSSRLQFRCLKAACPILAAYQRDPWVSSGISIPVDWAGSLCGFLSSALPRTASPAPLFRPFLHPFAGPFRAPSLPPQHFLADCLLRNLSSLRYFSFHFSICLRSSQLAVPPPNMM